MKTLVVGLGQSVAGDDGVGLRVLDELTRREAPDISMIRARDASALLELLPNAQRVIVVDAVLVEPAGVGKVLVLEPSELDPRARTSVSSHGISVAQAIDLTRALHPDVDEAKLKLVAIGIEAPGSFHCGLSLPVERAIPVAADQVQALVEE